jgi:hypothetical protein
MNYIITYADNNAATRLKNDMLYTLFNIAQFKGIVYILSYNIDKAILDEILRLYTDHVVIVNCDGKGKLISNQRNHDISALSSMFKEEDKVLCCDSIDVWFQDNIDELFDMVKDNQVMCLEEDMMATEGFALHCIDSLNARDKSIAIDTLSGRHLLNAGVILSTGKSFKLLMKYIMKNYVECYDYFGYDQLATNMAIRTLDDSNQIVFLQLPFIYNAVLINHSHKWKMGNTTKLLFTRDKGELIKIVHNAGGTCRTFPNGLDTLKNVTNY